MTGNHTLTCLVNSHAHCQLLRQLMCTLTVAILQYVDNGIDPTPAVEIEFRKFSWQSSSFLGRRVGCSGRKTGYSEQLPQPVFRFQLLHSLDAYGCTWFNVEMSSVIALNNFQQEHFSKPEFSDIRLWITFVDYISDYIYIFRCIWMRWTSTSTSVTTRWVNLAYQLINSVCHSNGKTGMSWIHQGLAG